MNFKEEIAIVQKEFEKASSLYADFCSVHSQVSSWKYATEDMFVLEPYFKEVNKLPKGRFVKDNAKKWSVKHCYDEAGRCIVTCEYIFESHSSCYETFFVYKDDCIWSYYFGYGESKDLICVTCYRYSGSELVKQSRFGTGGSSVTEFHYADGKLRSSESTYESKTSGKVGTYSLDYEHDSRGLLAIRRNEGESVYVLYYRISKEEFEELCAIVYEELCASVSSALQKQSSLAKVAILCEQGFLFPPVVMACSQELFKSNGGKCPPLPCDWDVKIEYPADAALMEKASVVSEVSHPKYKRMVSMLREVAAYLKKTLYDEKKGSVVVCVYDYDGNAI